MKLVKEIGVGECLSCGALALDVAIYEDTPSKRIRQCCSLCAYKTPWLYGISEDCRILMETIIYATNVIRNDINKGLKR